MQAPEIGGVRVTPGRRADRPAGPGRLADRPGREDQRRRVVAGPGAVQPGRDGDGHPDGVRGHPAGARRASSTTRSRSSRPRTRTASCWRASTSSSARTRAARRISRPVRRWSPSWVTSTTARPSCSTRSARPTWWRGEAGGITQAIGAYQVATEVDERRAQDHLHRHPGPRGVHRHACPRCEVDRHRRAGGGGRRRRDAADDRGAQPRPGGRRAGRGGGQQDRPRGCGPDQGARSAHRVRSGAGGVRRRHDVRRRLRHHRRRVWTSCSRRSS